MRKFGDENLRLIFSIADIQTDAEDLEASAEVDGEEADDGAATYPIRASLTITKVCVYFGCSSLPGSS